MVISVYLLKKTREKSVISDELLLWQDSEKIQAAGGCGGEGLEAAAAALSPGQRLDLEPWERRQPGEPSQCLAHSRCSGNTQRMNKKGRMNKEGEFSSTFDTGSHSSGSSLTLTEKQDFLAPGTLWEIAQRDVHDVVERGWALGPALSLCKS